MLNRLNTGLSVALAILLVLVLLSHQDHTRPNIEVLPHMKYSPGYSAFAPHPHLSQGRTLQIPVAGTIARGDLPLHYNATKEDAVRAGEQLHNPIAATAAATSDLSQAPPTVSPLQESTTRGAAFYQIYCITCHGAAGAGDGPIAKRGYPPPPSLVMGNTRQMKDGQLFHILTYGQMNMPPFRAQLTRSERWDLVNYLRSLQQPVAEPSVTTFNPATPRAPSQEGSDHVQSKPTP